MLIWHHGAERSRNAASGVSSVVWLVAREQAKLGHKVILLLDGPPATDAVEFASEHGLELRQLGGAVWNYGQQAIHRAALGRRPDVVHLHSVFVPRHAVLGQALSRRGIPYVVSPHGGLAPPILRRGWLKKYIYSQVIERSHLRNAAALAPVIPAEMDHIRAFVPGYAGKIVWLPNPIDPDVVQTWRWEPPSDQSPFRLVFLGRMDVWVKGIDIMISLASRMPQAHLDLYGPPAPGQEKLLRRLQATAPPNLRFHAPIYGNQKIEALRHAHGYIQMSRSEGFPLCVADAMWAGIPCAVSQMTSMSQLFQSHQLGLVVSPDIDQGAAQLTRWLMNCPERLAAAARAREFARTWFNPPDVARRYLDLYQQVRHGNAQALRPASSAPFLPKQSNGIEAA